VRPFPKAISEFVRKLLLSRESANLTTQRSGSVENTEGPYGEERFIYQASDGAHSEFQDPSHLFLFRVRRGIF
jgi:glutathionylspermidine synthase